MLTRTSNKAAEMYLPVLRRQPKKYVHVKGDAETDRKYQRPVHLSLQLSLNTSFLLLPAFPGSRHLSVTLSGDRSYLEISARFYNILQEEHTGKVDTFLQYTSLNFLHSFKVEVYTGKCYNAIDKVENKLVRAS